VLLEPLQTTIEAGVRLADVTFVVVDLETTGGSPTDASITEIGAVLVRGGERLGTFQTLVDPEQSIPAFVTHLTGIDDAMVHDAPSIEGVLPGFLEFARGAVFVAHNARFDFTFLNSALARLEHPLLSGPPICTAKLARRVVWPDVPNVRLKTLAGYFRTRAQPTHRALADAETCAEVLDGLLTFGLRLGIETLGDLHEACVARGRPNFGKIRLADDLPARPGVYRFLGPDTQVLYVGKSTDVRARVRSYFYGDERKRVQDMLEEVASVDVVPAASEVEALVVEARMIARDAPPYNRRGKRWRAYAYLKIDPAEAWPRVKTAREARPGDGCVYLGPFASLARARLAKEALEQVFALRRCTRSMRRATRFAPCALADMGRCVAPCDGRTDPERYGELVGRLLSSLSSPDGLLEALERRMRSLADGERFEEAALARDRLRALAEALWRARVDRWLTRGTLRLAGPSGERLEIRHGSLDTPTGNPGALRHPPERARADELAALRGWICRHPTRPIACDVPPSEPVDGGAALARILRATRGAAREPRAGFR
jgi:DNA polymerase-3 subunit epsilon